MNYASVELMALRKERDAAEAALAEARAKIEALEKAIRTQDEWYSEMFRQDDELHAEADRLRRVWKADTARLQKYADEHEVLKQALAESQKEASCLAAWTEYGNAPKFVANLSRAILARGKK
jgi:chromosome segregation ATPase